MALIKDALISLPSAFLDVKFWGRQELKLSSVSLQIWAIEICNPFNYMYVHTLLEPLENMLAK